MFQLVTFDDAPDDIKLIAPDASWFIIVDAEANDSSVALVELVELKARMRRKLGVNFCKHGDIVGGKTIYVGEEMDPLVKGLGF